MSCNGVDRVRLSYSLGGLRKSGGVHAWATALLVSFALLFRTGHAGIKLPA